MAWESGNAELLKKNGKFESFLKRELKDEVFERVRAYEACIIVSENENKTFKYIILSDEKLYLTENPPKALQEAVHIKDIVSVELVNEYPDFLTGDEKVNTQHIAITYMTSEPRRRSFLRAKKSPRGSLSELSETRSNASTPVSYVSSIDGNFAEDLSSLTHSTTSLARSSSWVSQKSGMSKKKRKPPGLNESLDYGSILRSLKEELDEDMPEDSKNDRMSTTKSTIPSVRSYGSISSPSRFKSRNVSSSGTGQATSNRKLTSSGMSDKASVSSSQQSLRLLPPLKVTKSSFSETEIRKFLDTSQTKEVDVVDIKCCCLFLKSYTRQKNQVAPTCRNMVDKIEPVNQGNKLGGLPNIHTSSYGGSQLSVQNEGFGSRSSLVKGSLSGTPLPDAESKFNEFNTSFTDLGHSSSLNGFSTLSVDGVTERRKCVLNIYLLNLDSPFLFLITSAWNSYLIKSTLLLEPEQFEITADPVALSSSIRDKVELKFNKIKRDLFKASLSLEEQYILIDQLCSSTKSNVKLKKLFWKNSDMLAFFIAQLQKYLPKSAASKNTEEGKVQRADEIEFSILVLSAINLMLRETEVLPCRLQTLKLEGGKHVLTLLKILMFPPELPNLPLTLMKHWSAPVAGSRRLHPDHNVDEELARLKAEYTHTSITAVFELILVAKQVPAEGTSILTVTGIISMFHKMKAVERFMDCLLSQIMELVTLSRFDLLSPTQTLLVFQMFYLLLTFLEQSSSVVCHVRNKYYEEFRYFIQAPAVSQKLPLQYPITAVTISIIDQVVIKVLGTPQQHHSSRDL